MMQFTQLDDYISNHQNRLVSLDGDIEGILNDMPFPIILVDQYYKILFANHMLFNASGLRPGSIEDHDFYKTFFGVSTPHVDSPLKICVESGENTQGEAYHKLARRWLRSYVQKTSLKSSTGNTVFLVILEDITNNKVNKIQLEKNILKQKAITESGIMAIYRIVEARDAYTASHQSKVGSIAYLIAKELGKSDRYASGIQAAGMLHDVGKITVPIEILTKPTALTDLEFQVIKNHPIAGYEILKDIEYEIPIADIALQHHERIDGSGYPYGLTGDKLHESTKIVSVADVVDAITSHRPYRESKDISVAISHLSEGAGKIFDKQYAEIAIKLCEEGVIQPNSITY